MKQFTLMVRTVVRLSCFGILLVAMTAVSGCRVGQQSPGASYDEIPSFEFSRTITVHGDTLAPVRLALLHDTLYVTYVHRPQLDLFSPAIERLQTIDLVDPEPIYPTSFAVGDSAIYIVDHAKRAVIVLGRDGKVRDSFSMLPDGKTPLSPLAIAFHGGVSYVTDIALRRVLAISMVDAPGVTERGELIQEIPNDDTGAIGFPSAIHVTLDGRLLVGDAETGTVRVFTCDGRAIYTFDTIPTPRVMAPLGFAIDGIPDPSLRDSSRFDPSNVHTHGRYHVVDGNNAAVHMFNPLGRYVGSYGADNLSRPSDIAIDTKRARIYIADPQLKRILVFRYEE